MSGRLIQTRLTSEHRFDARQSALLLESIILCSITNTIKQGTQKHCVPASNHRSRFDFIRLETI
jgi:hypothetical protein